MTKEEKTAAIAELQEELSNAPFFYIADSSTLTVEKVNQLRRLCFERNITMRVAKNTFRAAGGVAPQAGGFARQQQWQA